MRMPFHSQGLRRLALLLFAVCLVLVAATVALVQGADVTTTTLKTFATPGTYKWKVPKGVTTATFTVYGASGGGAFDTANHMTSPSPRGVWAERRRRRSRCMPVRCSRSSSAGRASVGTSGNPGTAWVLTVVVMGSTGAVAGADRTCARDRQQQMRESMSSCGFGDRIIVGGGGGGGSANGPTEGGLFGRRLDRRWTDMSERDNATQDAAGPGGPHLPESAVRYRRQGSRSHPTQAEAEAGGRAGAPQAAAGAATSARSPRAALPGGTKQGDGKVIITTPVTGDLPFARSM